MSILSNILFYLVGMWLQKLILISVFSLEVIKLHHVNKTTKGQTSDLREGHYTLSRKPKACPICTIYSF